MQTQEFIENEGLAKEKELDEKATSDILADARKFASDADKYDSGRTVDEIFANLGDFKDEKTETASVMPGEPTKRGRRRKVNEPLPQPILIPGSLFVVVVDQVMSNGLSALDGMICKKGEIPISAKEIELTDSQKKDLAPLAEAAVKEMKLSNDPVTVFFGSLAAIYLTNYLMLKQLKKHEK